MRKNTINNQFMDFSVVGKAFAEVAGKTTADPKDDQTQDKTRDAGTKESKDV